MRLNPAAIPNPNRIEEETALEWAANLGAPQGPVRELLADLLLSLGIHPELTGAEQAVLNMIMYLPGIRESTSQTQISTTIQLLHERIPFMRGNPHKSTNRLIRFHVLGADCPLYAQLGESMHSGIVGKYQQIQGDKEVDVNKVMSSFSGPINIVLPHLRNPEILFIEDVKTLKDSLKSVIKNLSMQRPGSTTRYAPRTVDSYANTIAAALLDRERDRQFVAKGSYKRRRKPKAKPDDSFYPDLLPTSHPTRRAYRDSAGAAVIAEMAEVDPKRAERIKKQPDDRKDKACEYWDPYLTIANPDKLSLHTLSLIEANLQQPMFISKKVNRLSFKCFYHLMLHTRRPADWISMLRLGKIPQVVGGPVLDLEAGLIYYQPAFYFGRPMTLIKDNGLIGYLKEEDHFNTWAKEFSGYEYAHPITAIPLPQLVLVELRELWEERQKANLRLAPGMPFLVWQNPDNSLYPLTEKQFKKVLKDLSVIVSAQKTDHRPITTTLIQNSFDAYYWEFGLSAADYWHISERAKYVFEMPVWYTLRHLRDLAVAYFTAHNRLLEEIRIAYQRPLHLPYTPLEPVDKLPELRMGSWHAIQPDLTPLLFNTILNPKTAKLLWPKLTAKQQRHNHRVIEISFLLGLLNGLRDFEPGQLLVDDFSPETSTLLVTGRGKHLRLLPVHPALAKLLMKLQRTVQKDGFENRLLWLHIPQGKKTVLTAARLRRIFNKICADLGLPELDFYTFRHRYRTDLNVLGVPDRTINYLMGHDKSYVASFTYNVLHDNIREVYLEMAEKLIERYEIFKGRSQA